MALVLLPLSFLSSPILPSSAATPSLSAVKSNPCSSRFQPLSFNGIRVSAPSVVCGRREVMVRASSDVDGKDANGSNTPKEGTEEAISVENLPLESKLQLKLEQKLRMKLAKKIRLRRKRLVRKRRMRKKGRWPPSKMKKNKNV